MAFRSGKFRCLSLHMVALLGYVWQYFHVNTYSVTMHIKCPNCGFDEDVKNTSTIVGLVLGVIGILSFIAFIYSIFSGDFLRYFDFYVFTPFVAGIGIGIAVSIKKCPKCDFKNIVSSK